MNYLALYTRICDRAQNLLQERKSLATSDTVPERGEKWLPQEIVCHLIIPAGIWGSSNEQTNIAYLTRQEQLIAYKLLTHIYPYSKNIADTANVLIKRRGRKKPKIRKPKIVRHSAETRAKMSASHRGKTFSAESRLKMSEAKKGKSLSAEHVANRSASRVRNAKGFSDMAKLRMSVAAKNRTKKNNWTQGNTQ